jgi:uridine kinase
VTAVVREWISANEPITFFEADRSELISYYTEIEYTDKVALLKLNLASDDILVARIGSYVDIVYQPLESRLDRLFQFDIQPGGDGLFVRIPMLLSNGEVTPWTGPPKQHRIMCDFAVWAACLRSNSISGLNSVLEDESIPDTVAEQCLEKAQQELKRVRDQIIARFPAQRLVTVGGASSSGKTTFSRLISQSLRSRGYDVLALTMDNFYKMRDLIPLGPDGLKDFECIEAFDVGLFADRIRRLLEGEAVREHRYSFVTGVNWDEETTIQLAPKGFLVIEGIHSVNPAFLSAIGAAKATKVFVAPMTPLSIDTEHCFPSTDLRLIRRIIRDDKSRGYPARATIRQWTSVRIGEERNICPNVDIADVFFNSSIVYELSALASVGFPRLQAALDPLPDEKADSIESQEVTAEVSRLLGLLGWIKELPIAGLPGDHWLRQFL